MALARLPPRFDRRRSAGDDYLIVYGVENGLDHARLGLSVSKKKVRKAFERNHVKRLLREAFRLSKPDLPIGIDLIVVPKTAKLTFALAAVVASFGSRSRARLGKTGANRPLDSAPKS